MGKVDFKVDYVVTHTVPIRFLENVDFNKQDAESCPVSIMLDDLVKRLYYRKWFAGHFHVEYEDGKNDVVWVYEEIKNIVNKGF